MSNDSDNFFFSFGIVYNVLHRTKESELFELKLKFKKHHNKLNEFFRQLNTV